MCIYTRDIGRLFLGCEESAGGGDNMDRIVLVKVKTIALN